MALKKRCDSIYLLAFLKFSSFGNSCNFQDEDDGSESDSSADFSSAPNYDSAVFQSSLKTFQMTESKRKKLRELEVRDSI